MYVNVEGLLFSWEIHPHVYSTVSLVWGLLRFAPVRKCDATCRYSLVGSDTLGPLKQDS